MFKFQTRSIEQTLQEFTKHSLPQVYDCDTPLTYDARMGRIQGAQNGFNPHMKAHELALLTLQENGSAQRGYKSVSTSAILQAAFFIGARLKDDFLIVSDISIKGELIHPIKISLQDLIGYETVQIF